MSVIGSNDLFGVSTTRDSARVVVIPIPWEVTTSYGGGASLGPQAVLNASTQVDLFDFDLKDAHRDGYHLLPISAEWRSLNDRLKTNANNLRNELEQKGDLSDESKKILGEINEQCARLEEWVHGEAQSVLEKNQIPAGLGGDHSTSEGIIRAVSESTKGDFGILHLDAHADLREHYQGFTRSHASIMHNVMRADWRPRRLVQVGIRDFCREEFQLIEQREDILTFFDAEVKRALFAGRSWNQVCESIVSELPKQVYVSFDIDALSPEFCPHTGTPVPGGLSYDQAIHLLRTLVTSGRRIVGFDLNEVSPGQGPGEWDGNVGARVLFKLCGWATLSQPRPQGAV